jgi:hypothetical protein
MSLRWNIVSAKALKKNEEIVCCLCLGASSEHPNEIVLCDGCGQGRAANLGVICQGNQCHFTL